MKADETACPVIILSGFLGAGKTTWLRSALRDPALADSAILVYEFGDIGIDHLLMGEIAPDVVLLQSGCICCQIRGELRDAVLNLLTQRARSEPPPFSRIIVETTGLADPGQIFSTFLMDPVLRHQMRLASVITIVDVKHGLQHHARQPEWGAQIAAANHILLSKTDLVDDETLRATKISLARMNPTARLALADRIPDLSPDGPQIWPYSDSAGALSLHGRTEAITLHVDQPMDWYRFVIWLSALIHAHGDKLLRVKCLLNTADHGVVLLDGVQHTLHPPQHLAEWPDEDRASKLVFISRGIASGAIEASLDRYVWGDQACD